MGELETLREEQTRLENQLSYAEAEVTRARTRMDRGDITFRLYLDFEDRVKGIKSALTCVRADIMAGEE